LLICLLAGIGAAALVGCIISLLTLRLNHLFLGLATLIAGQILETLATSWNKIGGATGLAGIPIVTIWPTVLAACAGLLAIELLVVRGSRVELMTRIIAHDTKLVELSGWSPIRLRVILFTISAAAAGFGGALFVYYQGIAQPGDLDYTNSLTLLAYVVIGGSTSGIGALIGGFVLTMLAPVTHVEGTAYQIVLACALMAVVLTRDEGLIPRYAIRTRASRPEPNASEKTFGAGAVSAHATGDDAA
jgi:branched-chain amino acid transport system permease protein